MTEPHTSVEVATTHPGVAARAVNMLENVIDDPVANKIADIALALVPAFLAVTFGISMIIFTWAGLVSPELYIGIASTAIGYYLAIKTGASSR